MSVFDLLSKTLHTLITESDCYLISPDAGATKRTACFSERMNIPMAIMHKQRDYSKPGTVVDTLLIANHTDQFDNKIALVVDDMIDSGGTFIHATQEIIRKGFSHVVGIFTHAYFTKQCIQKIMEEPSVHSIFVTNTVDPTQHIQIFQTIADSMGIPSKLHIIDCSPLLGSAIQRLQTGQSFADLF